ncbi:uncharacterized protein LOC108485220 [Gossypium arboreum]|uniref:uncharacterized protein LOC108485220 n=1 Tax=Gossypium arboreum TaxID=29729 RepID=UPI00081925A6|nr:uncharacterized protein LOC108485220 [Gossypium arboreum]
MGPLSVSSVPYDFTSHGRDNFINKFIETDVSLRQTLIISLWALWHKRNKLIYEGIKYSKQDLVGFIRGYCQEISSCHTNPKSFPISTRNQLWRPPNSGTSFLKESRISFAVILARNNEGQFFGACTYPFGDVVDAVVAETRTCKRAMLFAADLGWKRILLEGDSLTTIKKLNSKEEDRSILRPIINNIRVLRKKFENVSYLLVPRVVNSTAHTLRAFGLKNYRNQFGKLWRKIWKPRFREVEGLGIL